MKSETIIAAVQFAWSGWLALLTAGMIYFGESLLYVLLLAGWTLWAAYRAGHTVYVTYKRNEKNPEIFQEYLYWWEN